MNEEFDSDISDGEGKVLTGRKALFSLMHKQRKNTQKEEVEFESQEETTTTKPKSEKFLNKQRVLILSSRGITHRYFYFVRYKMPND